MSHIRVLDLVTRCASARDSTDPMDSVRADTVHVAECLGDKPAIGLHVYGGDIFESPRRMWNPQTLEEHPLDWTLYEQFARATSAAAGAPAP